MDHGNMAADRDFSLRSGPNGDILCRNLRCPAVRDNALNIDLDTFMT